MIRSAASAVARRGLACAGRVITCSVDAADAAFHAAPCARRRRPQHHRRRDVIGTAALAAAALAIGAVWAHMVYHVEAELSGAAFEPWWAWEEAVDGRVVDPDPVSWLVSDNDQVMGVQERRGGRGDRVDAGRGLWGRELDVGAGRGNRTQRRTIAVAGLVLAPPDDPGCPYRCDVVDAGDVTARDADAVVFDSTMLARDQIPARRHKDQLFVWMNRHSPRWTMSKLRESLDSYDNVFNLTMTYRRDSDIYLPPYASHDLEAAQFAHPSDFDDLMRMKSRIAYWMPQSCADDTVALMRFDMVFWLHVAGLDVEHRGNACWVDTRRRHRDDDFARYHFYLALGSALQCRDFVDVDDVWRRALGVGVVPVVWGAAKGDIRAALPRGSYIAAEEFASPYELANYLQFLADDAGSYAAYFRWRRRRAPESAPPSGFCQLCAALQRRDRRKRRVVPSLRRWWYGSESRDCLRPVSARRFASLTWWRQFAHLSVFRHRPLAEREARFVAACCGILTMLVVLLLIARRSDAIAWRGACAVGCCAALDAVVKAVPIPHEIERISAAVRRKLTRFG